MNKMKWAKAAARQKKTIKKDYCLRIDQHMNGNELLDCRNVDQLPAEDDVQEEELFISFMFLNKYIKYIQNL